MESYREMYPRIRKKLLKEYKKKRLENPEFYDAEIAKIKAENIRWGKGRTDRMPSFCGDNKRTDSRL